MITPALALMILGGVIAYVVGRRKIQVGTVAGIVALVIFGVAIVLADRDSSELAKVDFCVQSANRDELPCW